MTARIRLFGQDITNDTEGSVSITIPAEGEPQLYCHCGPDEDLSGDGWTLVSRDAEGSIWMRADEV